MMQLAAIAHLRRAVAGLAAAALLAGAAMAEPVEIVGDEINALLSGNTIVGTWRGTPYRQFFAADGRTVYKPEDGPPDQGRWRLHPEHGTYASWWAQSGWSDYYALLSDGERHYWRSAGSEVLEPFTVVEGRHLDGD